MISGYRALRSDRLSNMGLEYLRDLFDRQGIGLILIGMPGIEKRWRDTAQWKSRDFTRTTSSGSMPMLCGGQ